MPVPIGFHFTDANIFKPTPGVHPTPVQVKSVSLSCPHCRHKGVFYAPQQQGLGFYRELKHDNGATNASTSAVGLFVCPNESCHAVVMILQNQHEGISALPSPTIDFNSDNLPTQLLATLQEAIKSHAAGCHRAAAIMVRRLLEQICALNDADGANLHQKLAALKKKIVLPEDFFDAMMELKIVGNDAA
ncbi:MAG: DUF4145 domain-containing protein, partial [Alphaproteobacteria bacterium]|nr:DUF4145 domain-containing protein [Alphaproteobacteria bacterium]